MPRYSLAVAAGPFLENRVIEPGVIEGGLIVERGNHEQLYAARGRYYDLYTRQHGLEMNLFLAPGEGDKIPDPEQAVTL